ncbi:hypothetical protein SAICODRAFT_9693 [Saitoella complicata NRRL Y-17804]|nr:uncharacterized protein SAICODRAFT_9693 [Saitoella complicata NRRL Y-17804]ODQ50730.1 hypothetical protein SAICODRAFT_9693 [Saitoella complicata NRRL Y-17804]
MPLMNHLPTELTLQILSSLSPLDLFSLSLTSHAYHTLATHNILWEPLCRTLWSRKRYLPHILIAHAETIEKWKEEEGKWFWAWGVVWKEAGRCEVGVGDVVESSPWRFQFTNGLPSATYPMFFAQPEASPSPSSAAPELESGSSPPAPDSSPPPGSSGSGSSSGYDSDPPTGIYSHLDLLPDPDNFSLVPPSHIRIGSYPLLHVFRNKITWAWQITNPFVFYIAIWHPGFERCLGLAREGAGEGGEEGSRPPVEWVELRRRVLGIRTGGGDQEEREDDDCGPGGRSGDRGVRRPGAGRGLITDANVNV